jgi:V/A-type H+-transporting ATPase subunit E
MAAANKAAEDLKTKVQGDLKMAAAQSIAATKKDIETLVVTKMTAEQTAAALTSAEFVKEVILAVAKSFNTEEPVDLEVVLPEKLKKDLEPFVAAELAKALKGNVEATFTKKVAGGFTIGPKDGGYFISFTDETFNALISEYLRPATKKILFG